MSALSDTCIDVPCGIKFFVVENGSINEDSDMAIDRCMLQRKNMPTDRTFF
jgi:hypothetical protein